MKTFRNMMWALLFCSWIAFCKKNIQPETDAVAIWAFGALAMTILYITEPE